MADDDGARFHDCAPNRGRSLDEFVFDSSDGVVGCQQRDLGRSGFRFDCALEAVDDGVALVVREDIERFGFDLEVAVVAFDLALEGDDIVEFDVGVGADAGFLERSTFDGAGLIAQFEDGWAAGLADASDFALETDDAPDLVVDCADGRSVESGFVRSGVVGVGRVLR